MTQKKKHCVIAGNYEQYMKFLAEKFSKDVDASGIFDHGYLYVHDIQTLRGHENISGTFYGTWYDRKDIFDIINTIQASLWHSWDRYSMNPEERGKMEKKEDLLRALRTHAIEWWGKIRLTT
jgi:hypothetical protein